ncbi:hypothetical protein QM012_003412 [Aureobasidium pullulans]|uniref:Uncharacterized protein n=1 Tax=Aureobasidium pullulans TaxID=5580 RepID=A0ABR0T8Q1_AURPU
MSSHDPSGHNMKHIIQELESLQLPEPVKGYFLDLLKHMDDRDNEWAKVVDMWKTYEKGSSRPNKAIIEIMRNIQDIFMKDDDFLKRLYKSRPSLSNSSDLAKLEPSVVGILDKIQDIIDKDTKFFEDEHERHEEDMKAMNVKLDEMKKKLIQVASNKY